MQMWGILLLYTSNDATFWRVLGLEVCTVPYLYVICVCHTYWSKTIFSHSSLTFYKLSVLFQKLENRPTFLELACLVTDYFIPAKKSRSHLPISMRHTEDQHAVTRCHFGICPLHSQLLPVRSMPKKLHMEQEVW